MAQEITRRAMDIRMVLVTTIEDVIFPNGTLGKRKTRTLQFQTPDGNYLLSERPVEGFDEELLSRFVKSP